MKVKRTKIVIDTTIEENIREYGVRRLAKDIGVTESYISHALKHRRIVSERLYNGMLIALDLCPKETWTGTAEVLS